MTVADHDHAYASPEPQRQREGLADALHEAQVGLLGGVIKVDAQEFSDLVGAFRANLPKKIRQPGSVIQVQGNVVIHEIDLPT